MKAGWLSLVLLVFLATACTTAQASKNANATPTPTQSEVSVSTPVKMDTAQPPFNTTPPPAPTGTMPVREMPAPGIPPKVNATPLPFPQPEDFKLKEGKAYLNSYSVESIPGGKLLLSLQGNLPTPCHSLRVSVERKDWHLSVRVYSVVDPQAMCIQKLQPFSTQVKIGPFSDGKYTVSINGKDAGTFQIKH